MSGTVVKGTQVSKVSKYIASWALGSTCPASRDEMSIVYLTSLPESCFFEDSLDAFVRFGQGHLRSREGFVCTVAEVLLGKACEMLRGHDVKFSLGTFRLVKRSTGSTSPSQLVETWDRKWLSAQIFPCNFRIPWCWWQLVKIWKHEG